MKIDFRIVTKKDVTEVLNMMKEFNSIDNYPFNKQTTEKNLLQFIANENLGRAWLINSDGFMIGYIIFTFGFSFEHGGRDAFIDELYLKSEFRKKGLGKLAMAFIEEQAQRLKINVVHLEVEQHNEVGSKLYKEKGYKDSGRNLLSKKIIRNK